MVGVTFVERNLHNESEELFEDEEKPKVNKCVQFVRSRRNRLIAFITVFALIVPVLLFYFLIHKPQAYADEDVYTCATNSKFRIPCFDGNVTEESCLNINCCFDDDTELCYHSLPSRYYYYHSTGSIKTEDTCLAPSSNNLNLDRNFFGSNSSFPSLKFQITNYGQDSNYIKVTVQYRGETCDASDSGQQNTANGNFNITTHTDNIDITRIDGTLLLSTALGPLIASERYWEWSFFMGSDLFGLDRIYFSGNETNTHIIYKNKDNHTTIPAFMAHRDGKYHGLLFEISGPVEFMVLPSRLVSVRVLSGTEISFILMIGDTPKAVQQQFYDYYNIDETYPTREIPDRWLLQPHICRSGAGNLSSMIDEFTKFRNTSGSEEYVSDCIHDNLYYMLYDIYDNTTQTDVNVTREDLTLLVNQTRENDIKFILTVYPQILAGSSIHLNLRDNHQLLYQFDDGEYNGTHLDNEVVYVDYNSSINLEDFFKNMTGLFNWLDIDGYSLKDNWPSEETFEMESITEIPYVREAFIEAMSSTIPWNASTPSGRYHYNVHNSYANNQVKQFNNTDPNSTIFSSSYNYGMQAIPQMQHLDASWANLRRAIRMTLLHGLFGNFLIGIPVCGSTANFDAEVQEILCSRWYITAATFPMFTVSSDEPRRDHLSLSTGQSIRIAADALDKRKMFMPYYYTILNKREPITRPMFYDFPEDTNTFELEAQYMLGDGLIVVQPMTRDATTISIYLPNEKNGSVYYEFFGGEKYINITDTVILSVVVESDWIMFLRGGMIIPLTNDDHTQYRLIIGLNHDGEAAGTLFFNNIEMEMSATNTSIILNNLHAVCEDLQYTGSSTLPNSISELWIYGICDDMYIQLSRPTDLCSGADSIPINFRVDSEDLPCLL